MLNTLLKSIIDQDTAPIVVCDTNSTIVYMNPAAINIYHQDLTGSNLKKCHNSDSIDKIDMVMFWFCKNNKNNIVFTHHDEKENKDVYMIALRDKKRKLVGYYEKHEYRNRETKKEYDF